MKSNTFNYSLLSVGVAAVMGLSTGANAATFTTGASKDNAAPINNVATASYSVGTVAQPIVTSNTVTVNVSETANFSLVSTIADGDGNGDTAINQAATPNGTTTFTHALTNTGNVTDTYTINTNSANDPNIKTPNDANNIVTADYLFGGTTIPVTYNIFKADGTTPATTADLPSGQLQTGTVTGGQTIKLPPKFIATLSYVAATPSTRNGNDKGIGTLTATSAFFTAAAAPSSTLTNENQTIVRLPTYKITKTATSNVDLTATAPQIDYSITVTNATTNYDATATNFVIRDVLPTGITLTGNVTASGAPVTSDRTDTDGRQIIDVAVASLAAGSSQVITFKVNVAKASYAGPNASVTNNVAVYDKINEAVGVLPITPGTTNYDILDRTDNVNEVTRVPTAAETGVGAGVDTAGTTNFTRRSIVLTGPTAREIAQNTSTVVSTDGTISSGQVTHVVTITNSGQDTEGTTNSPITFTITDGSNTAVNPIGLVTVVYTLNGVAQGQPTTIAPTVNGNIYTINSADFSGGIAPGGVLTVSYNMASSNGVVGSSETTVVKLTPGGTGAPAATSVNDTTNVKGLTLLKQAAIQVGCAGTVPAVADYKGALGSTPTVLATSAKPGDCIFYKITASNTFDTGTAINSVALSDLTNQWKSRADYQSGISTSGSAVAITGTGNEEAVTTTITTIAGGASASLNFSIKVKPL